MAWVPAQDPLVSLSYAAYVAAGGADITETEWPRYLADAERLLEDITFGRISETTDTDILAKIEDATFRVADALKAGITGVTSEKLGAYSVTYGGTAASPASVARRALRGTGLTYAGISVAAHGPLDDSLV